jgi:site-specific DNA-adenine methylase
MAVNTFYFSYEGNKRREYKTIEPFLPKASSIKYFVEPFAGSASVAYIYSKNNPKSKITYVVNDIDTQLIKFYESIQKGKLKNYINFVNRNLDSEAFNRIKNKKNPNVNEQFYRKKVYNLHMGINPFNDSSKKTVRHINISKFKDRETFDKKAILSNLSYNDIFESFKNKQNAFLFIDPPYLNSSNRDYSSFKTNVTDKNVIIDNTKIYIDILDFMNTCKCKVMVVINSNSIMKYIFQDYIKFEYQKTYDRHNKQTQHLILTNY